MSSSVIAPLEYDEMKAAVDHAVATFGKLDVVMANAGISTYGTISVVDPASFKRVIDINLTGVFNTVHAAMPELLKTKGYALCVASLAAYAAAPGMAAYDASKAGCDSPDSSICRSRAPPRLRRMSSMRPMTTR